MAPTIPDLTLGKAAEEVETAVLHWVTVRLPVVDEPSQTAR
jgi:hypothetical protein